MRFSPPVQEAELYETVFDGDYLNRSNLGKLLSQFVDKVEDPLVIALDGKWGTGKTFFLKRWVGAHTKQNDGRALTVYFDAFAHDYISDPLIGLTLAISERIPAPELDKVSKVKALAAGLARPLGKAGLAILTSGVSMFLDEIGDAAAAAVSDHANTALDEFWKRETNRKHAFESFREALEGLTRDEKGNDRPIVFVIDELDRCRPDYALEVLEIIKHFFTARNLHFVLGVNFEALENMVASRYGARTDAGAYLRKFISVRLEMPNDLGDHSKTPAIVAHARAVSEQMGMPSELRGELVAQIEIMARQNSISLRDVNTILSHLMVLPERPLNDRLLWGWRSLTVTLVIARVVDPVFYRKLCSVSFSKEELSSFLDVTPEKLGKVPGKEGDYHHPTFALYAAWLYVLSNGVLPDDVHFPTIDLAFEAFGKHRDARSIPMKIYRDWLSVYRIS